MRTEDLIAVLAEDTAPRSPSLARSVLSALVIGGAVSVIGFLLVLGVRPDIAAALGTWRFDWKLVQVAALLIAATITCIRLSSPEETSFFSRALWLPALMLLAATGIELVTVPPQSWPGRLVGTNALICLTAIPALAIAPMIALLVGMRDGAPGSPVVAGAAVGLVAAALAATLYALHCFDDSPLFVAAWYTLAASIVTAAGALAGSFILRW